MSNMVLGGSTPNGDNNNEDQSSLNSPVGFPNKASLAEVVKRVTGTGCGVKKMLNAEEDVLVMDTKLKIIEILQVACH